MAKVLAKAIERAGDADLILTATESSDGYTGVVPEQIAELLSLPSVTFAKEITVDGSAGTPEELAERIVAELYGGGLLESLDIPAGIDPKKALVAHPALPHRAKW